MRTGTLPDVIVTIGVDIGTTAVKAAAVDEDGNVVAATRIEHPVLTPVPGAIEHDALAVWHHDVRSAAAEVASEARRLGHEIAAVNVAAMVPSLCTVDADGRPTGPGMLYSDPRVAASGPVDPSASGEFARLVGWMAERRPDAAGYWPAQAVANAALTGTGAIDSLTAYSAMPLCDGAAWDPAVAASLGVSVGQLPTIVPGSEAAGVCVGFGPVLDGVPVAGGSMDAFCEQVVAGADETGDVLVILGATLIVWAVVDEWTEAPGLWTLPHTARGKVLIGGASNAGGIFRNWASRVLRPVEAGDVADLDDVPVFLPYVRGERTPLHDPSRRGEVDGLHVAQGPAAMWRGVHEATGFSVRHHLDLAGVLDGGIAKRIVLTGGGAHDEAWVQAIADATGLPVDCLATPEGGARGAAFLARVTAGLERNTRYAGRWGAIGRRVAPDPTCAAPTAARYERYRAAAEGAPT